MTEHHNSPIGQGNRSDVLRFIQDFIVAEGIPPTVEQISLGLHLSKSTVHKHIVDLEDEGQLLRKGRRRLLTIVPK